MNPKKIAFLTDSCADIDPKLAEENHIYIVPLRILCSDGEYLDGVDIHNAEIYERLHAGELPKTSLPSPEEFEDVVEQILADGFDGIVAIMMSSGLSGTYNMARLVAEGYSDRVAFKAFDTLNASLGQGMTLLQAAKDVQNGMGWEELTERRIPKLIANTKAFFSVDTLEYLLKGGRIGKVTAAAGTLLHIKPIISFSEDGQLVSVAKARGQKQVMQKLVEMTTRACGEHTRYNLAVANGGAREAMESVRKLQMIALPDYDHIWEGEIDGTLSVYIGDGILGAAVQILD